MIINGTQFYIDGVSAYIIRPFIILPCIQYIATSGLLSINTSLSSLRVLVDHNYRDLKQF